MTMTSGTATWEEAIGMEEDAATTPAGEYAEASGETAHEKPHPPHEEGTEAGPGLPAETTPGPEARTELSEEELETY